MFATAFGSGAVRCCELYHCRLLVYLINLVCEPGSNDRALSDTFAGIRPSDVPLFIPAQIAGGLCATFLFRWFVPNLSAYADQVVMPHQARS
jgi:hypothetical protein